ncbi:AraC family transcriptional regulator [Paractinoplanes durhamensis]|uniref:HTH araC/xylS-type domain-containing protein n=1 Tax=Paractinoplanes durhamensis TaxID=113563 RepID=A0ABQ3YT49_9ACTN|nr:helix-turn-helix domain-containing protein [Actinoplanes durhamensis]GIE00569.1 hypothetical protein Adu01nite_19190 [Actinoplanes durhamensis]
MIHSVPVRAGAAGCETVQRAAAPALRGHVLGYGGFRSADGRAIAHRLLPISVAALIVDFAGGRAVVTGPRAATTTDGPTTWGHGVTVGLTPAGVHALLGVPMRELVGATLTLDDLPGAHAAELPERLAQAPDRSSRFRLLDELLAARLGSGRAGGDGTATGGAGVAGAAWRRLQQSGGRLRIGELAAELGVGRRGLERDFRGSFGLSPGAVGRIARFQRALRLIGDGVGLAEVAAAGGYADQPHLTRETRAMAGVTPGELRAIVQDRPRSAV